MDKKYQCFISSTFIDLQNERQKVYNTIHKMKHIPVGMEYFNAANESQWKTITRIIDSSDYYIIIIGHRYGSICTQENISFTEKEYNYAVSMGIPILRFIRKRDASVNGAYVDTGECKDKLDAFIKRISADNIVDTWYNAEDLSKNVVVSLVQAFSDYPRDGWIKYTQQFKSLQDSNNNLLHENTLLRKQLESMQKNAQHLKTREPKFEISFGDMNENIEISLQYENMLHEVMLAEPELRSIPPDLEQFCSIESIDKYNLQVKEVNLEISGFNNKIDELNQKRLGNMVPFFLKNCGTAIARDVIVEIYFPDDFLIIFDYEYNKINKIVEPKTPSSPLLIAEKDKKAFHHPVFRTAAHFISEMNRYNGLTYSNSFDIINAIPPLNSYDENKVTIENNYVKIELDKINHNHHFSDEIVICPPIIKATYTGKFVIKCAELPEPYIGEFTINVS